MAGFDAIYFYDGEFGCGFGMFSARNSFIKTCISDYKKNET
jgi:hypothetical protein